MDRSTVAGNFQRKSRMTNNQEPGLTVRSDGRGADQLRPLKFTLGIAPYADGSVLISAGNTQVICAATIEHSVPRWMKEQGIGGGWLTAEYSMLPYSTLVRRQRDISKGKLDGRSIEIQRLIGRALRAAIDLDALGERTLWIDCDVLQADGGTRTASITGASIAIASACAKLVRAGAIAGWPLRCLVAAISVGVVRGRSLLDLNYEEDRDAEVDMNLVMTSAGTFVEMQGAGEEATFTPRDLNEMIALGQTGITRVVALQRDFLRSAIPEIPEI
jgi:ribonuclease PH